MKNQTQDEIFDNVDIAYLTPQLASDLKKHLFFGGSDVLNQGFSRNILQSFKLIPGSTRLVARNSEKTAIGFLCLEENKKSLFSIKYVFVDPNYRKMGVGTKLLKYALFIAKKKGARKVNLNVYPSKTNAINLYKKLGFNEFGRNVLSQGYLLEPSRFKVIIKRILRGQGSLTKLSLTKSNLLFEVDTGSREVMETLFSIYKQCMGHQWIDFYEINLRNFTNGSRHMWQPPFFKEVLATEREDTFALVFNRPFSHKASVEIYSNSEDSIPLVLDDLWRILSNRGISLVQFMLFNLYSDEAFKWFEDKQMTIFQFTAMGAKL